MISSAIGMSLVSANLPNWPHCAENQLLHAHRQKGPPLWVKLVYIEPSFHAKSCSPSSIIITVNQLCRVLSLFQLLCPVLPVFIRGVLIKSTILRVQLLRRNPSIYPEALLHPPMWLFGLKEAIVSTSFILLSPFWFLNWKSTLVPPSVTQKPIVCLIRYHPA